MKRKLFLLASNWHIKNTLVVFFIDMMSTLGPGGPDGPE